MRYAPYSFAIAAGLVLMVLEQIVSDAWMVMLICAATIAHVWLTRSGVHQLVQHDRSRTVDATIAVLHLLDHGSRRRSEQKRGEAQDR